MREILRAGADWSREQFGDIDFGDGRPSKES